MSVRIRPDEPERPVDLTALTEDDVLLDQLGRGEIVTDAGEVEAMLSGWRASLPQPRPVEARLLARALAITARRARPRRLARMALGVAVAVALTGGGVTAAAANAGPDSPLWPVTRLMYSDVAESRLAALEANRAVTDAEDALDHGHLEQASRLLDEAASRLQAVSDPATADVLRTRLDAVRAQLSAEVKTAAPPALPGGVPATSGTMAPPATETPPAPAAPAAPAQKPGPEPEAAPQGNVPAEPPRTRPSLPIQVPNPHPGRGSR